MENRLHWCLDVQLNAEIVPVQAPAHAVAELCEVGPPVGAGLVHQAHGDLMTEATVQACATGTV